MIDALFALTLAGIVSLFPGPAAAEPGPRGRLVDARNASVQLGPRPFFLVDEYKQARVPPQRVFAQSFNQDDVLYWIAREPAFGMQAVYLDSATKAAELPGHAELAGYKAQGINIVAPPIFALLAIDAGGQIVPSRYAIDAKAAGLGIIAWTLERSGILADGGNGFYYQTFDAAITREGDMMRVLDVLAKQVGIRGIFSDWPATVSFYANCMGLK